MPDLERINDAVKEWGKKASRDLKERQRQLHIKHSPGANWQRRSTRRSSGLINRISFRMPRHAIFVHKGVGRGTPISRVGQTRRIAKEWFNPVMDRDLPELADAVANEQADLIINNVNIQ